MRVISLAMLALAAAAASLGQSVEVSTGREVVAAFLDDTVTNIKVIVEGLTLREEDFVGLATINIRRNFTWEGAGAEGRPVILDLNHVREKVRFSHGVRVIMRNFMLLRFRSGILSQVPGLDILLPTLPGDVATMWLDDSLFSAGACFPPEVMMQAAALVPRPPELPGSNDWTPRVVLPPGCDNTVDAGPLDRCYPGATLYRDWGTYGANVQPSGSSRRNGYLVRFTAVTAYCTAYLSTDCIVQLGPLGCWLSQTTPPPPPSSAAVPDAHMGSRTDGAAESALPPAMVAATSDSSSPAGSSRGGGGGGGGDGDDGNDGGKAAVLAGVLGGVGAAVVVSLLALLVVFVVRRRSWRSRCGKQQQLPANVANPTFQATCDEGGPPAAEVREPGGSAAGPPAAGEVHYPNAAHNVTTTTAAAAAAAGTLVSNADTNDFNGATMSVVVVAGLQAMALMETGSFTCMSDASPHATSAAGASAISSGPTGCPSSIVHGGAAAAGTSADLLCGVLWGTPAASGNAAAHSGSRAMPMSGGVGRRSNRSSNNGAGGPPAAQYLSPLTPPRSDLDFSAQVVDSGLPQPTATVALEAHAADTADTTANDGGARGGEAGSSSRGVAAFDTGGTVTLLPTVLGKGSSGRVYEGVYQGRRVAVKVLLQSELLPAAGPAGAAGGAAWETSGGGGSSQPPPQQQEVQEEEGGRQAVGAQQPPPSVGNGGGSAGGGRPTWAPRALEEFRREVEVLGRCEHANIVKLLAVCLTPPRLCLVMEVMETSLEKLIFGGGLLLPLSKVVHIALQIARGLEYLHPSVVHRDLKPANVLLMGTNTDKPQVKISDFGISRIWVATQPTKNPGAGTPAYIAPECFDVTNSIVNHHADVYSFGVVVWAMLTAEQPWKDYSMVAVAVNVALGRKHLPLSGLSDERCPRKLRQLLARCWDFVPERRPAAAEAVKELLLLQEELYHRQAQ